MDVSVKAAIENRLQQFNTSGDIGIALGVYQGGQLDFSWCSGIANRETGEPVTSHTNFRLASVTKQFTAAAILLLEDDGVLSLTDPIKKFLPDAPPYTESITVGNLTQHTSGLPDYEDLYPKDTLRQLRDSDVERLIFKKSEGYFAPGEQFRYSNSGYALLARIVANVAETTFPTFLSERIFKQLKMERTLAYVNAPKKPEPQNRAIGYRRGETGDILWADQNPTTAVLGDGGVYCNLLDYGLWLKALYAGSLISAEAVHRAWTPGQLNDGSEIPYGLGWRLEKNAGKWQPYHPGCTSGFSNCVRLLPEERAVLLLSNLTGLDAKGLTADLATLI